MNRENIREHLPTDQENIDKAVNRIANLIFNDKETETELWVSAMLFTVTKSYIDNNFTYHEYATEMIKAIKHYKYIWDNE